MTITDQMNARRDECRQGRNNLLVELRRFEVELKFWRGWGYFLPPKYKVNYE